MDGNTICSPFQAKSPCDMIDFPPFFSPYGQYLIEYCWFYQLNISWTDWTYSYNTIPWGMSIIL